MLHDDTKNGSVADYCNGSQSIQNRKNQLPFHQTESAACVLGVFWAGETALFMFVLFPLLLWSFKLALPRAKEEKQALKARCVRVSVCARGGAAGMSRTLSLNSLRADEIRGESSGALSTLGTVYFILGISELWSQGVDII